MSFVEADIKRRATQAKSTRERYAGVWSGVVPETTAKTQGDYRVVKPADVIITQLKAILFSPPIESGQNG
ncbi:hypothetical protein HYU95_01260 [Candidatus Daviesbacteria bacterium]|nr:hypothetical protein [Candidatus Daviesbacteria bacterium]